MNKKIKNATGINCHCRVKAGVRYDDLRPLIDDEWWTWWTVWLTSAL